MAGQKAERVRALIDAITSGDTGRVSQFYRPGVVQHDPNAPAHPKSFQEHLTKLATMRPDIRIVRLLEDGDFVVAQLRSDKAGQDRFAVYRFEGDQIAEQWAFFAPAAPPNKSGHTQTDGPRKPKDLEHTEANKRFVRTYYEAFHLAGRRDRNDEFFVGDMMMRHEPGVEDGLQHFLSDVEQLMKRRTIDEIKLLIGQGDLVFIAAAGTHEDRPCAYIDLYRVQDQKLVEHWGFPQVLPTTDRTNTIPVL